jgi:glutamate racemase
MNKIHKIKVGLFDSGVGGIPVFMSLNKALVENNLSGNVVIKYLGDTKNFPYGTKTTEELQKIVSKNIHDLTNEGCSIIGIACNTASVIYNSFTIFDVNPNIIPVLNLAAGKASAMAVKNLFVISSDYTANENAYKKIISQARPDLNIYESGEQTLIDYIEKDNKLMIKREIEKIVKKAPDSLDSLVLGCTHFSHIKDDLANAFFSKYGFIQIIEPTELLVTEIIKKISSVFVSVHKTKGNQIVFSGYNPDLLFSN